MANSGIQRIDQLYAKVSGNRPIVPGDADAEAVAAIQDLLRGHNYQRVRDLRGKTIVPKSKDKKKEAEERGVFGRYTTRALTDFRKNHNLGKPDDATVDADLLHSLVETQMKKNPRVNRLYVTLKLGLPWDNLTHILALIAAWEGSFLTRITGLGEGGDKQGLSYGILQWTQRSGRLYRLLKEFKDKEDLIFRTTFGNPNERSGPTTLSDGLLAHTKICRDTKTKKPVCQEALNDNGTSKDPKYKLNEEKAWLDKFETAGLDETLQRLQVKTALSDLGEQVKFIRGYVNGLIHSVRGYGLMLDASNQLGNDGAKDLFESAVEELGAASSDEKTLLAKMAELSPDKQQQKERRSFFATTELLSLETEFPTN